MWSGTRTLGNRTTFESGKIGMVSRGSASAIPEILAERAGRTPLTAAAPAGTLHASMDQLSNRNLVAQLNCDARRIAERFGLRYRSIEAERANVKRRYGVCYSDGSIRIRLRHATSGRPLKYSSLVNTLCHELAHLRHFNHGPRFKAFYLRLLEWARREGIYRPLRRTASPPAEREPAPPAIAARAPLPRRRAASGQLDLFA
jgi:hypothetical protein